MKKTTTMSQLETRPFNYSRLFKILGLSILVPVTLYYLWFRGVVYFKFSRTVYTDYFWFRAPWLLAHVLLGITATLIGPLQFLPSIRRSYPAVHRRLGKIYVFCVFISTIIAFYLATTSQLGLVYALGLSMLGVAWLTTTAMGWWSIRKGRVDLHKISMLKSYVLTLGFVCNRAVEDLLAAAGIGDFIGRKVLMAWACWAVPLFVTEVVLQIRSLYSGDKEPITE